MENSDILTEYIQFIPLYFFLLFISKVLFLDPGIEL